MEMARMSCGWLECIVDKVAMAMEDVDAGGRGATELLRSLN